eukprot:CAMPEP_0168318534 /NCGR_PEP_ID=MMETSP0213-20121227/535_1 /TAXON_ID=151035 /ORGANISM="Euplotes harpa, Strain FSP1.4" /LENGTH=175 /DNA_ID=CAMNT_0008319617 /DNA_START=821 /DNA_END=1348 /DNA_ORIENTATION=+
MDFDEYFTEFQHAKRQDNNKSPGEHRSKYFNDVFTSSINLGSTGKQLPPNIKKVMMEINSEQRGGRLPMGSQGTPVKSEYSYRSYLPDYMPHSLSIAVDEKDLVKPKGRFKNWQPAMRNLESTYDVKDVKIRSDRIVTKPTEPIDPTRRVQLGGKKLFMTKEFGIERANNLQSGE